MSHHSNLIKTIRNHLSSVAIVAMGVFSYQAFAETPPMTQAPNEPKLVEKKSKFFDAFEVSSSAKLSSHTKIYILEPEIAFSKRWERDHHMSVSKRYKEKTKSRYSKIFKEVLMETFDKNKQLTVVDSKQAEALTLSANILELNIYAPDDEPGKIGFVKYAGKAQLVANISDSDNNLLAKIEDTRETNQRPTMEPDRTSSLLNERDFKKLMRKWARNLEKHITTH